MNSLALTQKINTRIEGMCIQYLEIRVDDIPLQQYFAGRLGGLPDAISPLGWSTTDTERQIREDFDRFLLRAPSDLPNGRNSILVCPLDGDLGCGAYTARFTRDGSSIYWFEFGYENNYDLESLNIEWYSHMAPFVFDKSQYEKELLHHLDSICGT